MGLHEYLDERFLSRIVDEVADGDTVGIALTGSHARGDATRHSDVDLLRFVEVLPGNEAGRYTLVHRDGYLVSLTTTTISAKRGELASPQEAIWTVPGLRQARVLLDRDGSLRRLKEEAEAFRWEPLQEAADEYASYTLMGYAEEVHKVLGGLVRGDGSAVLYGTLGLFLGLTKAVAVQRGVLLESENSYFRQVQGAVGRESGWTRWLRLSAGFDAPAADRPLMEARGVAGLRLYGETARLLRRVIRPEHKDVIEKTLEAIRRFGLTDSTSGDYPFDTP